MRCYNIKVHILFTQTARPVHCCLFTERTDENKQESSILFPGLVDNRSQRKVKQCDSLQLLFNIIKTWH